MEGKGGAMARYTIGVDFGTRSGRAVLVDVSNGRELATAVYEYAHGVIDQVLPHGGPPLPPEFALQDPKDYLRTMETTIPAVLKEAGVDGAAVIGIGVDCTSCTILPTFKDGRPLCCDERFRDNPHAWVKLWRHHAAQPEATALNAVAATWPDSFLPRYGGKLSSEGLVPKVWQILNEAPEVYDAAERIIEAGDWVVRQLSGVETRNACAAGYKALWSKGKGFPAPEFFARLDPRLRHLVDEKLSGMIVPAGKRVGGLTPEWANKLGLVPGTAVAAAQIDAHAAVPATTVVEPGKMVLVMGTSVCHMVLDTQEHFVEGICGVVEDGIIPGFYGYEAGQACVGDLFAWFVENAVSGRYEREAAERGISIYALLEEKAGQLRPGESGLLALDWWNGNRSVLVDVDLSGLIVGYTVLTPPEAVYRALFEGTAFGTHTIIQAFEHHGIVVDELYVCGGLPTYSPLLMQIFADVTGKPIKLAASGQTSALGAAMFAAVAAGKRVGGHNNIAEAAKRMARLDARVYVPDSGAHAVYERIYQEYRRLHDYFGRGGNDCMKRLRRLRDEVQAGIRS
jgi:L-ribulokinase